MFIHTLRNSKGSQTFHVFYWHFTWFIIVLKLNLNQFIIYLEASGNVFQLIHHFFVIYKNNPKSSFITFKTKKNINQTFLHQNEKRFMFSTET